MDTCEIVYVSETVKDEDQNDFCVIFSFYYICLGYFIGGRFKSLGGCNELGALNRDEAIVLIPCSELTSFVHRALQEIMGNTCTIAACVRKQ